MTRNGPLALSFHALVMVFMLAPLVVVCLVAFTPENTLKLAALAASLATLIAVPAGLALTRYSFPGQGFVNGLLLSPIIIPHLVLGVALLRLFALLGVNGSFAWLVFAHVVVITPYVLRLVLAAAIGIDRSAEQAAQSLGAGRITLFCNSFDEVTLSIFVTSPATQTLPVRMYVYATESIDPMMAAVSALVIAVTALTMIALDRVYGLDRVLVGKQ